MPCPVMKQIPRSYCASLCPLSAAYNAQQPDFDAGKFNARPSDVRDVRATVTVQRISASARVSDCFNVSQVVPDHLPTLCLVCNATITVHSHACITCTPHFVTWAECAHPLLEAAHEGPANAKGDGIAYFWFPCVVELERVLERAEDALVECVSKAYHLHLEVPSPEG
eukprot:2407613-Pyramimonas_sp.AAC.1